MRYVLALLMSLVAAPAYAVPLTTQAPLITMTVSSCSNHAPIAGGGSGSSPQCDTLTSMLDSAFSSSQGSLLYRNASAWVALAPGTNGFFLETQGPGANLIWAAAAGGSGCTIAGGAQFQIIVNNGSSGCSSSPNATVQNGALVLGTAGSQVGSVALFNATSGSITVSPPTGALGSVTLTLPDVTDTLTANAATQTLTNKSIAATEVNSGVLALAQNPTFARAIETVTDTTMYGGL